LSKEDADVIGGLIPCTQTRGKDGITVEKLILLVTYTSWFTPKIYTGGESKFTEVRHWYMFSECGICVFFKAMLHHKEMHSSSTQ
jgi:hypothetical protein